MSEAEPTQHPVVACSPVSNLGELEFAMQKLMTALVACAVVLGGASAVIAQQGPREDEDRRRPNAPIQGANPANQSADESSKTTRPAAGPNDKASGPVEPKKEDVYPTAPKGPADHSAPPPKN